MTPDPTWRDFTWIDGTCYRVIHREPVSYYSPKPGDTSRKPEMIHVAFTQCQIEVAQ